MSEMLSFGEMKNVFAVCFAKNKNKHSCAEDSCDRSCSVCPLGCLCRKKNLLTLDRVNVGDIVSIEGIKSEESKLLKLSELGLLPGAEVMVREKAPFGGPVLLYVLGTILTIRESEASLIMVEKKELPIG